jgi:hypothetical protein
MKQTKKKRLKKQNNNMTSTVQNNCLVLFCILTGISITWILVVLYFSYQVTYDSQSSIDIIDHPTPHSIDKIQTKNNQIYDDKEEYRIVTNSSYELETEIEMSQRILRSHPIHHIDSSLLNSPLEDIIYWLKNLQQCQNLPVFASMANVGSDLYWQL